ncbi:MAG: hypothetical protein ABJV04_07985 [Aliiglaciecola sp.]|uniref:hypothetical protein n=1 Tax=Aliiglaciecola sp. TaxID=1872441 RepID=UPI003296ADA7
MKKMIVSIVIGYLLMGCSEQVESSATAQNTDSPDALIETNKPSNVVFILVDDLGYSDIKAYNQNSF